MAEDISSVGPTGKDFLTLKAMEAAISANPTNDQVAECYIGNVQATLECESNFANSNAVTFIIRAAAGQSVQEQANWPAMSALGTGTYVGTSSSRSVRCLSGSVPVTIQNMEFDGTGGGGELVEVANTATSILVERCVFHESSGSAGKVGLKCEAGSEVVIVRECFFTLLQRGILVSTNDVNAAVSIVNCTAFNNTNGFQTSGGAVAKTMVLNCVAVGNGSDFVTLTTPAAGSDYWVSSDTSASTATNNWQSVTASAILESTTGTIDMHLLDSVDGTYDGNSVHADLASTDIDGDTRTDYDCGADEIVAAGGGFEAAWATNANTTIQPGII